MVFNLNKKQPLSEQGSGQTTLAGRGCGALFGSVFLFVGLAIMGFGIFWPMLMIIDSGSWEETNCTIISSRVDSSSDSDGTTYKVDIVYEYEFNGQRYQSNRYDFSTGYSSGSDSKEAAVDAHPAGSQQICYVDPDDPQKAVIDRSFNWIYAFIGAFGSVFAIVGGVIVFASLFGGSGASKPRQTKWAKETQIEPGADGPVVLEPEVGRVATLGCIIIAALFWNGITWMGVASVYDEGSWGALAFMSIFVLVGLFLIAYVIYLFLAVFNPKFTLTLTSGNPEAGERVTLHWKAEGAVRRIREFSLEIKGEESATYRRGTDTVTEKETFLEEILYSTTDHTDMSEGEIIFTLPPVLMHTFEAPNNKVKWTIKVKGDIAKWPDIGDEYVVLMEPAKAR